MSVLMLRRRKYFAENLRDWAVQHRTLLHALLRAVVILPVAAAATLIVARLGWMAVPFAAVPAVIALTLIVGYRLWYVTLVGLLLGYMFASRGFAGVGIYPIYVGEAVMGLGILTAVLAPFSSRIRYVNLKRFAQMPVLILCAFLLVQILQTVPYIRTYQFDTLRDAMTYGYAIFGLLVMLLLPEKSIFGFFDLLGKIFPYFAIWSIALFVISRSGGLFIIYSKGSDTGVHLAGMGVFFLLQLNESQKSRFQLKSWLTWIGWLAAFTLYVAMGRATLVTIGVSCALVVLANPIRTRWFRPFLLGIGVISLMLATNTFSLKIDLGLHREVSVEQMFANVTSIFGTGDNNHGGLEGTKQWRLEWWDYIIDYTFNGRYFWTGKGYGVNLANDDGFQVQADESLRSPHNGHMTFLARSGVPGFVLWLTFLGSLALSLLRVAFRSKYLKRRRYAMWLLAYLIAFQIMTFFDVFIEGPMGGIWFWALMGMSLAFIADNPEPAKHVKLHTSPVPVSNSWR